MADTYQDAAKLREEQDRKLQEWMTQSGLSTSTQPSIDLINEQIKLKDEEAAAQKLVQKDIKNEQVLQSMIEDANNPINSKEDFVARIGRLLPNKTPTNGPSLSPDRNAPMTPVASRDTGKIIDETGKEISFEENARREAIDEGRLPVPVKAAPVSLKGKALLDKVSQLKKGPASVNSEVADEIERIKIGDQQFKTTPDDRDYSGMSADKLEGMPAKPEAPVAPPKVLTPEEELEEAKRQRNIMQALGMISQGFSQASAAKGGGSVTQIKPDTTIAESLGKFGEQGVTDAKERIATLLAKSKAAKEDRISDAQIKKLEAEATKLEREAKDGDPEKLMKLQMMKEELLLARERFNALEEERDERKRIQLGNKIDKGVETISKRLESEGTLGMKKTINDIDGYLAKKGWDINDISKKGDNIQGVGLAGGLRPDFLTNDEDLSFRQSVQSMANQILKKRSGAAVTDPEYARFLKEAGSGNFSNMTNLISGLQKMKNDVDLRLTNSIKSANPVIQEEFYNRTGLKETLDKNIKPVEKAQEPTTKKSWMK